VGWHCWLYDVVRGLDVLDDGGVEADRYHRCFHLSLSHPSIGDDDQSVSVQILMVGRAAHDTALQFSKSAHVQNSLVPHSLTLPLQTAAWPHAIIAQSSPASTEIAIRDKLGRGHGPVRPYTVGLNDELVLAGWDRGPSWNTLDTQL
jgi:hypothetical protein